MTSSFEGHMHCNDCMGERDMCSRCGRFQHIRRISRFPVATFHSRAITSIVALWFERALAIGALVFRTLAREAPSVFVRTSCCFIRCIRLEYIRMLSVLMFRTCCTRGICTLLVLSNAQVLCIINCIACSAIWRTCCRRCSAIQNHNERRPCGKIIA